MLNGVKKYLRYTSWPIFAAMVTLMTFGVLAIRASALADPSISGLAGKQMVFACLGLVVFFLVSLVPYSRLGHVAYAFFGVMIALLVLVFFLPEIRGSHRWVDLKIVQVQPSEIMKLAYIILLAWHLRYRDNYRRLTGLIIPFVLTILPVVLILMEPDLGTSLLFLPTLYFMLFMAGAKLKHLLAVVAMGAAAVLLPIPQAVGNAESMQAAGLQKTSIGPVKFYSEDTSLGPKRTRLPIAYCRFQIGEGKVYDLKPLSLLAMNPNPYQLQRIEGWLRQDDPRIERTSGFHLHQSKMVLGAGKLTGCGGWRDAEVTFRMLPDDHTDFIFSVIGGRWGMLGCAAVLFLYGVIFLFGFEIAVLTYDPFGRLLAVGVLALLFSQMFINVGMTMGIMPITGMTLPMVSYGGSSLVVNCAALGLLVNVGLRRPILLGRRPFEYDQKHEKPPAPYGPLADDAKRK